MLRIWIFVGLRLRGPDKLPCRPKATRLIGLRLPTRLQTIQLTWLMPECSVIVLTVIGLQLPVAANPQSSFCKLAVWSGIHYTSDTFPRHGQGQANVLSPARFRTRLHVENDQWLDQGAV